jgi:putative transcriptional regulator
MGLAKLGFLAVLVTVAAYAPLVADNLDAANGAETTHARSKISPPIPLPIQSKNPELLGVGKILVASRNLGDPNFAQTVILLVQYDAGGVVGLILNRRSKLRVSSVLGDFQNGKDRSEPVYFGGPVDSQQIRALRKSSAKVEGATQICPGVYQIATKAQLEQTLNDRAAPKAFHVYLGYAGWHVDQLQKETELGAWFVFPGDAETIFKSEPDLLWPQMIRKTEMQMARNESADAN